MSEFIMSITEDVKKMLMRKDNLSDNNGMYIPWKSLST